MADNKTLNARLVNKHDVEANWLKAVNFAPLQGEIIVYDIDENYNYERFKIGDGTTNVSALPFVEDIFKNNLNIKNGTGEKAIQQDGNTASGDHSAAFGVGTVASGNQSVAMGIKTEVAEDYGIVVGKFNEATPGAAVVVGNGNASIARSNAATIDWDGNVWFAGNVSVGENKVLATQEYVDNKALVADWSQNDENAADYVKNRTHWEESQEGAVINNLSFPLAQSGNYYTSRQMTPYILNLSVGAECTVIWDGNSYNLTIGYHNYFASFLIGNHAILGYPNSVDTGEPFIIVYNPSQAALEILCTSMPASQVLTVYAKSTIIHKLDAKYLPDEALRVYTHPTYTARTGAPTSNANPSFGGTFTVSQVTSNSLGHVTNLTNRTVRIPSTVASATNNGLMSAADKQKLDQLVVGEGGAASTGTSNLVNGSSNGSVRGINTAVESDSYTMGENALAEGNGTQASGSYSHAEGSYTIASAAYTHAEGYSTEATADGAHAEGNDTLASGMNSHAEGNGTQATQWCTHAEGGGSKATNNYAHAEGNRTIASGYISHAEGNVCKATGSQAHAEGDCSEAKGTNSHAEGEYSLAEGLDSHAEGCNTIAKGEYQHVQGRYNIEDTNHTYAHIVGNGSSSARSNAHTLDWDGNARFAGDVYAQGTGTLEDAKKLATEEYVNNSRTHWTEGPNVLADNVTVTTTSGNSLANPFTMENDFVVGSTYTVTWNGTKYECIAYNITGPGFPSIGAASFISQTGGNGEPFLMFKSGSTLILYANTGTHTFSIEECIIHKIDNKYLPDFPQNILDGTASGSLRQVSSTVEGTNGYSIGYNAVAFGEYTKASGTGSFTQGASTTATGDYSHAEGCYTTTSDIYSHAEGQGTTASGIASHAEGQGTTASGASSHAEGSGTKALNQCSHAEGTGTTANGECSHAEGAGTTTNGAYSHAEGGGSKATNTFAHAEGYYTTASGLGSHAEGNYTESKGMYSHAEGNYTIANSEYQHVQGKCNIEDANNTYAHIVGNGTSTNSRSNAYTLDWYGNAWFAGEVKVGGTNQSDEAAQTLATESYVDSKIPTPEDALALMIEMGFVDPIADETGAMYTDDNGKIFTY